MRTTIRIESDLLAELKQRARQEKISLTQMVNRTLRAGLTQPVNRVADQPRYREASFSMGSPKYDLRKALALAASLEDEEIVRKLQMRK